MYARRPNIHMLNGKIHTATPCALRLRTNRVVLIPPLEVTNPWGLGYGVTPTNSPSMPSSSSGLLLIAMGSDSAAAASIAFSAFSASFVKRS